MKHALTAWLTLMAAFSACGRSPGITVRDDAGLREALKRLAPGVVVRIAPGVYQPGLVVSGARGTADKPIVIEAMDADNPPVFIGGSQAWHLSDVSRLTLRGLVCRGQQHNGINVDDGGSYETPSQHVVLEKLHVEDTGPHGNFDAIKCSGVDHLKILDCRISGWGGQAIDFVGCHHAEIARCVITGKPGYSQHTGPQFKGGASDVWMHHCRLENAGLRPVQIGGSTGLEYFRPKDAAYEARNIRVEDNLILGGQCAVAFTGADQCVFARNTIVNPEKWILRILQENPDKRFVRCGDHTFSNNLVVFERGRVATIANIGPDTRAESFRFRGNHWFASDAPPRSTPDLPSPEEDGVHGVDPKLDAKTYKPGIPLKAGRR